MIFFFFSCKPQLYQKRTQFSNIKCKTVKINQLLETQKVGLVGLLEALEHLICAKNSRHSSTRKTF